MRLLFEGLPPVGEQAPTALPLSLAELSASPLALPEDAPVSDEVCGTRAPFPGWTAREKDGVRWLERPMPGLPAPVYLTGAATSSLDAARLLVEAGLFPEWASVLCL